MMTDNSSKKEKTSNLIIAGKAVTDNATNYNEIIKYLTVSPQNQNNPDFKGTDVKKIQTVEDPVRRRDL